MPRHELTNEERAKGQFTSGKVAVANQLKSAEAKKRNRTIGEIALQIKNGALDDKKKQALKKQGISDELIEEATYSTLIGLGLVKKATEGDTKAIEKLEEYESKGDDEEKIFELPARLLGSAFVDINREFVPNKSYVFKGGRGSFKSSYVSMKIIELIKNNPRMHACVVRQVQGTLKDSVYAQIKWAINELGLNDEFKFRTNPLEITLIKTGQTIYFRGCDDPIKLKSIKPPFGYIGILWKEEKDQLKSEADERSINQSVLRGDGDAFYDISSYNPPKSKDNWVNKVLLVPDPNRIVHHSTYEQAYKPWLGQKFVEDAERLKIVNPDAYEHEYLGVPNGIGGNVFENVECETIPDSLVAQADTIFQGLDFGWFPDPIAFVRLYYDMDSETIYFLDELYENKLSNAKVAEWIFEKGYEDCEIVCDSAEPKSINDLRDAGLRVRGAIKGAGSIEYGIKWLQCRKIVIDPHRTPNAYNEFTQYEFEKNKDGDFVSGYPDGNNHTIDATRYAMERYANRRGTSA